METNISELYRVMSLIRKTDEALLDLFSKNELSGTTHTSIGQEANAVGIVKSLDLLKDAIWSSHRCHGHFIAYSENVNGLIAEIMGKRSGVSGGRGGSQHLCYKRFYSSGVQGGIAPLAVGTAHAIKNEGAIAVVFLGDGTMGQGVVYESLNLASLWSVPILFVVEDNGIAQTTPIEKGVAGSILDRARPFNVQTFSCYSTHVLDLQCEASKAIYYVRNQQRPAWLYTRPVRLGPHSKGDDTRDSEFIKSLWREDPLVLVRDQVSNWEVIDEVNAGLVDTAINIARQES
jgi:acetoin:2,6-dichlorophenolindophenol oxidoreductase subunit alpha